MKYKKSLKGQLVFVKIKEMIIKNCQTYREEYDQYFQKPSLI